MGLFSKEKRISTSTQTISLIEDTPDVVRQSITTSLLGNTDIVTDLQNNFLHLFKDNVRRYYNYGRDYFTNGLPEGYMGGLDVDETNLKEVLETITVPDTAAGESLVITLAVLDQAIYLDYFASEYLFNNSDWNPETNMLSEDNPFLPGTVIYYYPNKTTLVDSNTLRIFFNRLSTVDESSPYPQPYIEVEFSLKYPANPNSYYYYTRYIIVDADGNQVGLEHYWTYLEGAGDYPILDVAGDETITSQYMPIVPLRIDYKSYTNIALKDTELYKTSKRLLSKVNLKMSELDEAINENPDIDQVAHAYIVLGVDVKQDTQEVCEYIYSFFDNLVLSSKYTKANFDAWSPNHYSPPPVNIMTISDGTYKSSLNYYYITKETFEGNFGKKGTYRKFINADLPMIEVPGKYDYDNPDNTLAVDYQLTDTIVQRITVAGLSQTIRVYQAANHIITLSSDENEVILLPLNKELIDKMKPLDANTLAYHSLKVVMHAYKVTYLKWYQTMFFKFVMIVIVVVLTIYTGYLGSFVAKLTAAAAAGAAALAVFVIQTIIYSLVMSAAFKFVAKELGVEFVMILAMVAMAYGFIGSDEVFSLPYADSVLAMTGPMFDAVQSVTAEAIEDISSAYNTMMDEYKVKQKEIAEAWKELQPPSRLDPLGIFTAVDMPVFESPNQYIERKTTSNIADIVGYNAIQTFYENALNLYLA